MRQTQFQDGMAVRHRIKLPDPGGGLAREQLINERLARTQQLSGV